MNIECGSLPNTINIYVTKSKLPFFSERVGHGPCKPHLKALKSDKCMPGSGDIAKCKTIPAEERDIDEQLRCLRKLQKRDEKRMPRFFRFMFPVRRGKI